MAFQFQEAKRPGGRRRNATPYDNVRIQSSAQPLNQGSVQSHMGGPALAPRNPATGQPLNDSAGNPLDEGRFYGTGRTKQQYTSGAAGTTRMPLTGNFRQAVLQSLENQPGSPIGQTGSVYPNLPDSDRLFVSVDASTGELPPQLGGAAGQAAIAAGSDAGIGYIRSTGNGAMKVGGTSFVDALKNRVWSEDEEAKNVAFAMLLGGPQQAENLAGSGYAPRISAAGQVEPGSVRGSGQGVKPLAAKSGNKRLAGANAFALRANQQSRYWQGGDNPAQLAQRLATDRGDSGLIEDGNVHFPMDRAALQQLKAQGFVGARGRARTGIVFMPRDQAGNPQPMGMDDNRFQCKVENSGPGISDFKDEVNGDSAGFRLFKRRGRKTRGGSQPQVACSYSPDIFVNTATASYLPAVGNNVSRTIGGNSLADELANRPGGAAVATRLQQGYAQLNANRDQFYGRSLRRKPPAGQGNLRDLEWQSAQQGMGSTQAKLAAWNSYQGL